MNYKNIIVAVTVAVSLFLSVVAYKKPATVVVNERGEKVGAFSPYAQVPEVNLGGLRLVGKNVPLATGTSTVCAIDSPTSTSTLVSAGVRFVLASTSAVVVDFGKSTTPYATSTRINAAGYSLAASASATIVASTTGSVAGDATIFAPSTYFVAKYSDNNNGTGNASTGSCWAVFAVPQ